MVVYLFNIKMLSDLRKPSAFPPDSLSPDALSICNNSVSLYVIKDGNVLM